MVKTKIKGLNTVSNYTNKKIEQGKKAFNSGQYLENLLIEQFKVYKKKKLAYIDKIYDEKLIQKIEQLYLGFNYNKKLRVDFIGYTKMYNHHHLSKQVFVGIEAKQTIKDYLPYSMIRPHQLDYLYFLYKNNGIAFFVVGFINENAIIRWWVNSDTYKFINETITNENQLSKGINLKDLIEIVGTDNVFTYQNYDILGIL